jgi:carbon monoxide dehydrogenase subunit G
MKVAGEAVLHAPIDQVWAALNDPAVLVRTIPGCERLEAVGADSYSMTVTAGVASIKGTYSGTVALSDQHQPNSFLMRASGSGGPGTVSADVRVALTEVEEGTRIDYAADAVVGGVIGGVGQRMLGGVAKKMAGQFFSSVDDVLSGREAAMSEQAGVREGVSAASGTAGPPGRPGPAVYVAPAASRGGTIGASEQNFALGVILGAAIALFGVLVGSRVGRAKSTRANSAGSG